MIFRRFGEALSLAFAMRGLKFADAPVLGVNQCQGPPAAVSVQHPIYQPTMTMDALSDFTPVMALFEGLFQSPPAQYPCGAALPEPDEFGQQTALGSVTASLGARNLSENLAASQTLGRRFLVFSCERFELDSDQFQLTV
jgi:hypothetical protein